MDQQKVTLTPGQMVAVKAVLAEESLPMMDRLGAAVSIVHGIGAWMATEAVEASATAIPEAQWKEICGAVIDAGPKGGGVDTVNWGMTWMNYGPSTFVPEEVTA